MNDLNFYVIPILDYRDSREFFFSKTYKNFLKVGSTTFKKILNDFKKKKNFGLIFYKGPPF
jgi:hypothetical protein